METRLVRGAGEPLHEALRSMAAADSINGLGVFAAEGSDVDRAAIDATLRELSVPVFGGIFPEVLYRGERQTDGVVLAGLTVEPTVTVVPELSGSETEFGDHLPADVPEAGTAFVFVDAYATRAEDFVSELFASYGVTLTYLGGGAGSLDMEQRPSIITNEGVVEDTAVFVTVDAATSIGVKHGWEEVAGPLRVTDADGPVLGELNGESAFSVYKQIVEEDADVTLDADNFFEIAKMYPFGISRLEGEKIVRDPFEVTDDGSLTCFGDIPDDAFLYVLKGSEESLVRAAGEAYDAIEADIDGQADDQADVLFFDCISRVLYLEDAFTRELDAVGGETRPDLGALTIGEIANDGEGHLEYYNKTAVAAITDSL
ncbi:histidine kinase [Halobellus sp. Atlit-31R]|nr:histidine kinase [Halobellus sp. Atlit-31R]